jgi:hypothetical protein
LGIIHRYLNTEIEEAVFNIKIRQFKELESAIAYAIKEYKKYLLLELKKISEIVRE